MRLKLSFLTILFSMVSVMAIGQVIDEPAPPPPPPRASAPSEEIFMVVEQMPEFPGCEEMTDKQERKQCSQEALLAYVYSNLVYPEKARENRQEGMAVVTFIVAKDGSLENIKVVRDPGAGLGDAAAMVIHKMNKENIRWNPGTQRGRSVAVRFNLPVRFKLDKEEIPTPEEEEEAVEEEMEITVADIAPSREMLQQSPVAREWRDEEVTEDAPPPPPLPVVEAEIEEDLPVVEADKNYPPPPPPPAREQAAEIFKVVENMPRYMQADCESLATRSEKKECAQEAMLSAIYDNLQYPAIAKENGVEGTTVVTFVVEKDGSLSNIRLIRDIGAGCGQEAVRLVEQMSAPGKWVPGKQRGRAVKVQFNLPVKFRLDD
ncbi:energy transducer TonB [Lewinella cohaerens]|uniref:energy transducer TonB n=1 Tax=Lewinella cohaerens TaxID=70995 RepID=UPI00035DA4CC|nr:energy transducer TonB [Lewinella cohaerens]